LLCGNVTVVAAAVVVAVVVMVVGRGKGAQLGVFYYFSHLSMVISMCLCRSFVFVVGGVARMQHCIRHTSAAAYGIRQHTCRRCCTHACVCIVACVYMLYISIYRILYHILFMYSGLLVDRNLIR
jgi:hypothetical protein